MNFYAKVFYIYTPTLVTFKGSQPTQRHASLYHIYKVPTNDEYLSVPVF